MEKSPAGWKVYDIKVDDVSLVMTYRGTFDDKVRDDGIEGLIQSLTDKNRQVDRSAKPKNTTGSRMLYVHIVVVLVLLLVGFISS